MRRASKGHFLTQMPQPLQIISATYAFLSSSSLIASRLVLTMGQNLMQTVSHLSDLHRSLSTTATLKAYTFSESMVKASYLRSN